MSDSAIEYRSIRADECEQCLNLWEQVWPGPGHRDYFTQYFDCDIEWLPYYTQAAFSDGILVGCVHVCKRQVSLGGITLTLGGIANVAVHPEYRNRGIGTECMQRAIYIMEADAMDVSILFTGIPSYYRQFKYESLVRPCLRAQVPKRAFQSPSNVRLATANDVDALREIYSAFNENRPFAVERSNGYWRDWVRIQDRIANGQVAVSTGGSGAVTGYLIEGAFRSAIPYSEAEHGSRILEIGWREDHAGEEPIASLLEYSLSRSAVSDVLMLEVPYEDRVFSALDAICGPGAVTRTEITSGMARFLNKETMLRSMLFAWNASCPAGFPAGIALTLDTPYGLTAICSDAGVLEVADDGQPGREMPVVSQQMFFESLSGMRPCSDAAPSGWQAICTSVSPIAVRPMAFWGADGF